MPKNNTLSKGTFPLEFRNEKKWIRERNGSLKNQVIHYGTLSGQRLQKAPVAEYLGQEVNTTVKGEFFQAEVWVIHRCVQLNLEKKNIEEKI